MKRRINAGCIFLAGLLAALVAPAAWGVITNSWTNAAGGRFDGAGNWNPAGPPGASDFALLDAGHSTTGRVKVTFSSDPSVTNKTANLTISRNNTSNRWEFAIGDENGPTTYEAGFTQLGIEYAQRGDLLLSTGTLVSSQVYGGFGYDAQVRVTLDGPGTVWRIDDYWANRMAELNITVQNGAHLIALARNGGNNARGNPQHEIGTRRVDGAPKRPMLFRVTGSNTLVRFTGAPTVMAISGSNRFEILDGATAIFSNLTVNPQDSPLFTVVSNATLNTAAFALSSAGLKTNIADFVNSTCVVSGNLYVADYYGYTLLKVDNTEWTMLGQKVVVGAQDGLDGTTLTVQNGSRMIGTNCELAIERGIPSAFVVVQDTNTLLMMKTIYVAGSSGNLLSANKGATLTVSNGATVAASSTLFVYGRGLLRLSDGIISNATTLGVVGRIEGNGVIRGSLEVGNWPGGGTVLPGGSNAIGRLDVGNLFRMVNSSYGAGRLELEVGGIEPGSGYDQIAVTNAVTLALGPVSISTVSGFKPPIGVSTYDLITGSSLSTNGATVSLPPSGDGVQWSISIANLAGGRKALRLTAEARAKGTVLLVR